MRASLSAKNSLSREPPPPLDALDASRSVRASSSSRSGCWAFDSCSAERSFSSCSAELSSSIFERWSRGSLASAPEAGRATEGGLLVTRSDVGGGLLPSLDCTSSIQQQIWRL